MFPLKVTGEKTPDDKEVVRRDDNELRERDGNDSVDDHCQKLIANYEKAAIQESSAVRER